MRTLYLDCGMGAAGDMLMAALLELCEDKADFLSKMNSLGLPGVRVEAESAAKCGIIGTHMLVTVNGEEEESLDAQNHGHSHDHTACDSNVHEYHAHSHEGSDHHGIEEHGHNAHEEQDGQDHQDHDSHDDHSHDSQDHQEHDGHDDHSHDGHDDHSHDDHSHDGHDDHSQNGHDDHSYDSHDHHSHGEHDHHSHEDHDGHTHNHHGDGGHTHSHRHSSMHDIEHMVGHMEVSERVKKDVMAVYRLIAEAESHAHGMPVEEIHFHEVGTLDAVADVAGVCILMERIGAERIVASPVHVGSGQVRCAHGILPVPAPATAHILQGVPIYGGSVQGELCTPTGAALLKHFVTEFGGMPVMKVTAIGYGMGKKDFQAANCVRASLGDTLEGAEEIVELCCNLDDCTPEELGFAQELLMENGALDVYTTAIGMKKCRPGVMLTCMCRKEQVDRMKELLFRNTTTLGIREYVCSRTTLVRKSRDIETEFGTVRRKEVSGFGVNRGKLEYEDLARIAKEKNWSLEEVRRAVEKADSERNSRN